ncbi:MAG: LAGLIDADG family homing endonuclease [Patescibacteria group bacterium]|jgi:ribosomal protein L32
MSNVLDNFGMVAKKSLILKFPRNLAKEMLPHFIRGYNDGDGCIEIREKNQSRVEILGTNDFCNYIKFYIMENFHIKSYIRKYKKIFKLSINGSYTIKFLDWIYNNSNIHLVRKYNKYVEAKSLKQWRYKKSLIKKCSICGDKHYAKGLCHYHYYRNKRLNIKFPI